MAVALNFSRRQPGSTGAKKPDAASGFGAIDSRPKTDDTFGAGGGPSDTGGGGFGQPGPNMHTADTSVGGRIGMANTMNSTAGNILGKVFDAILGFPFVAAAKMDNQRQLRENNQKDPAMLTMPDPGQLAPDNTTAPAPETATAPGAFSTLNAMGLSPNPMSPDFTGNAPPAGTPSSPGPGPGPGPGPEGPGQGEGAAGPGGGGPGPGEGGGGPGEGFAKGGIVGPAGGTVEKGEGVIPAGPMAEIARMMSKSPIRNYMDPRSTMLNQMGAGQPTTQQGQGQQAQFGLEHIIAPIIGELFEQYMKRNKGGQSDQKDNQQQQPKDTPDQHQQGQEPEPEPAPKQGQGSGASMNKIKKLLFEFSS